MVISHHHPSSSWRSCSLYISAVVTVDGGGAAVTAAGCSLLLLLLLLLLLQACQSSLNTAGLALIMQTVATGLLVTASIANEDYSGALGDGIQVGGVHHYTVALALMVAGDAAAAARSMWTGELDTWTSSLAAGS